MDNFFVSKQSRYDLTDKKESFQAVKGSEEHVHAI